VRSNTFVDRPWQLREFKTDINAKGEAVFVADSVKSNRHYFYDKSLGTHHNVGHCWH
jgi:hypothetical protein